MDTETLLFAGLGLILLLLVVILILAVSILKKLGRTRNEIKPDESSDKVKWSHVRGVDGIIFCKGCSESYPVNKRKCPYCGTHR